MAFVPDITLVDSDSANVVYDYISSTGTRTIRKDMTRALETPRVFTISHEASGKGVNAVDRHLVRLDQTELDSGDGVTPATGSVHLVMTVPRAVITTDHIYDLIAQLKSYLTEANVTKVLAGSQG